MIATVRIAPVERWCLPTKDFLKFYPGAAKSAGLSVRIDTSRVRHGWQCGGREWFTPDGEKFERLAGRLDTPAQCWICEHMLEMD